MQAKDKQSNTKTHIVLVFGKWLIRLGMGLFLAMAVVVCALMTYWLRYDIAGHMTESLVVRYLNSQLLWSGGGGSCCSSEWGVYYYLRWTDDSLEAPSGDSPRLAQND